MGRPQRGPEKLTEKVNLRLSRSTKAALDNQRGQIPRSEYVRRLIVRDSPAAKKVADDKG